MSRRRYRKKQEEEPMVNLTPLIDIVFSILIMFIVVAPLLDLDRVELAAGNPTQKDLHQVESSSITLHVQRDNSVWLNKRPIEIQQLPLLLLEEKGRHPEARPQLFHDKNAYFGTYQQVKNALERAGFAQVDVILSPS